MKNSNMAFMEGQYHFLRGEFGKSISGFGKALETGMDADKIHVPLGMAYFKNGNFSEAAAAFSQALNLDPTSDHLLFLRGMTSLNQGDTEKAVDDFNASIRLNDRRGAAYVARSLALRAMHWNAEAANDLRLAVTLADVEVELFLREYCIAPPLRQMVLSLFDLGNETWGKELWKRHASRLTH